MKQYSILVYCITNELVVYGKIRVYKDRQRAGY